MSEIISGNLITEICENIVHVIKETSGRNVSILPETKLVQDGYLDSVALVSLVLFLQTKYDIAIDVSQMNEIYFATPISIINLIKSTK
jgi:acyl carrier protein